MTHVIQFKSLINSDQMSSGYMFPLRNNIILFITCSLNRAKYEIATKKTDNPEDLQEQQAIQKTQTGTTQKDVAL